MNGPERTDQTQFHALDTIEVAHSRPQCIRIADITIIALFVIGGMGVAGYFPGSTLPYTAMGVAGAIFIFKIAGGNLGNRKLELIATVLSTAIIMTAAGLSIYGSISHKMLSWIIVGTSATKLSTIGCLAGVALCFGAVKTLKR